MKKLIAYMGVWKKYIFIATCCMLLSTIFSLIPFFALNKIVSSLVLGAELGLKWIAWASAAVLAGYLGKAILVSIGMSLSHKAAFGVLLNMRKKYAENMIEHPMGQIMKNGVGRYKKGFVEDVELIETSLAHLIPEGIPYVMIVIFLYLLIFITDFRLGLCTLAIIPLSFIPLGMMTASGSKKMPKYYASIDALNSTIIEYIRAMEVVKIFNKTDTSFGKYKKTVEQARDFTYDWYKTSWLSSALLYAILPTTLLLTLPFGYTFYKAGSLSFEEFTFILILNLALSEPLIKLVEFTPNIPQVKFALDKLEETFATEPLQTGKIEELPSNFDVKIKDMTFAYGEKNIFDKFNLTIEQGKQVALVGESGSGKSTLVKLIAHFWDVKEGSIQVGNRDIRDYSSKTLMDMISYVSQDSILFSGTIMENLLLAREGLSEENIVQACKEASCHEFIIKLKDGYDTEVGNLGKRLSGGERQRLTIVRAILKDAPIVILDEVTSHTDAENEANLQEAMRILLKDKTVIRIAHRLSLITDCDKIVVLNKGNLEAVGTHDELLNQSISYKNLWERNLVVLNWGLATKEVANV